MREVRWLRRKHKEHADHKIQSYALFVMDHLGRSAMADHLLAEIMSCKCNYRAQQFDTIHVLIRCPARSDLDTELISADATEETLFELFEEVGIGLGLYVDNMAAAAKAASVSQHIPVEFMHHPMMSQPPVEPQVYVDLTQLVQQEDWEKYDEDLYEVMTKLIDKQIEKEVVLKKEEDEAREAAEKAHEKAKETRKVKRRKTKDKVNA